MVMFVAPTYMPFHVKPKTVVAITPNVTAKPVDAIIIPAATRVTASDRLNRGSFKRTVPPSHD